MATTVRFFEVSDRNGDVLYHSRFTHQRPYRCPVRRFPEKRIQDKPLKHQESEGSMAEVLFVVIMLVLISLVW